MGEKHIARRPPEGEGRGAEARTLPSAACDHERYTAALLRSGPPLDEWDQFVDESPQGCIFCRSWWLDAVCPDGYEILVLRNGGKLVAGMPLPRFSRHGYKSIDMPPLTQTLGVLLAPPSAEKYERRLSNEVVVLRELVQAIPPVDFISFQSNYTFTNWLPFYWGGYSQTTRYTYVFEDLSDLDAVLGGMAQAVRTEIRKAEKRSIRVEESEDLDEFWELNRKTWARQGVSVPYTRDFLKRLDYACTQHKARTILVARDGGGNAHAGIYVVHDTKAMYYLMQGGDPELRSSGANPLATWRSIQLARERGLRYDFEGSMIENVEPFFRHFGARQTPYFRIWRDRRGSGLKAYLWLRSKAGQAARALGLRR